MRLSLSLFYFSNIDGILIDVAAAKVNAASNIFLMAFFDSACTFYFNDHILGFQFWRFAFKYLPYMLQK